MDEPACPGCQALQRQVAELRAQVAEQGRRLEQALAAGKRQAAPFRKGPPEPKLRWVAGRATTYAIDERRSASVLERVIGQDWSGVLRHDGFASYGRFGEAIHQQRAAHVLRRARDLLEWATRGAVRFPRQVIALFTEAIHLRNECLRGVVSPEELATRRDALDDRLLEMAGRPRPVPEHERLAKHLWKYAEQWFGFLSDPTVEATNWQAEQAVRPAVVNRKVYGGNRTAAGAQAQGVLMSVLETCRWQARSALDHISQTLRAVGNLLLPRPVLLPSR
jgi:transposase